MPRETEDWDEDGGAIVPSHWIGSMGKQQLKKRLRRLQNENLRLKMDLAGVTPDGFGRVPVIGTIGKQGKW